MSRPKAIDAREAKYDAVIAQMIWQRLQNVIPAPARLAQIVTLNYHSATLNPTPTLPEPTNSDCGVFNANSCVVVASQLCCVGA